MRVFKTIMRRFGGMVLTLAVMSLLIFILVDIIPGDAAAMILGQSITPESYKALRESMQLDDPLPVRYGRWMGRLLQGDPGMSLYMRGVPINTIFWRKLGHSAVLAITALIFYVPLSIFFGVLAGIRAGTWSDMLISFFGLATMALPEFVSGILLISIFSVTFQLLPITSIIPVGETLFQNLHILVLPALSVTIVMFGYVSRMQRSSMIQVMKTDYVRAAELKGLPHRTVIIRHALRNALLPTITIIGMNMGWLFGGLIVVETLFGYPGIGSLTLQAIKTRDIPLIEICVLFITVVFVVSSFLTELLYSLLNPQIRYRTE